MVRFYRICCGDMAKVRECVAECREEDVERWNEEIIEPAIRSGEIERLNGVFEEDQGNSSNGCGKRCGGNTKTKRRSRLGKPSPALVHESNDDLMDTDDDDTEHYHPIVPSNNEPNAHSNRDQK